MSHKTGHLLACFSIPDARGIIRRCRNDLFPIGTECGGIYTIGMSFESANLLFRLDVPDIDRFITGRQNDPFPVGAECEEVMDPQFHLGTHFSMFQNSKI